MSRVAQELRSQCANLDYAKKEFTYKNAGYLGDIIEDLNEDEKVLWSEAEMEAQEAMAVVQQAKNTLRQARMKQHNVKLSRQYFKTKTVSDKFKMGVDSSRPRDDSKMTCLRCGRQGHRVANCPDPPSAAKMAEATEATSSFICFNEVQQAMATGITAAEAVRQGKAVIDGGATRTLASIEAMQHIMALNQAKRGQNGILGVDLSERPVFGFGNGSEDKCASTIQLQVKANSRPGEIKVHCLDRGSGPLLLSVEALRKPKAVIDFEHDLVCLRALDDTRLIRAERSQTGHQLIPLTDDLYSNSVPATKAVPSLEDFVNI